MAHRVPPMSETDSDPRRRPSVDLLIHKLRGLKTLKNHPDAVQLILADLVYQFFVNEEKRPAHLWAHINHSMYSFLGLMGGGYPARNDAPMREFTVQQGVGTGGNPENQLWPGAQVAIGGQFIPLPTPILPGEAPQDDSENQNSKSASLLVLRKDEEEKPQASGVNLEDKAMKIGVETVIFEHYIDKNILTCGCGRNFEFLELWAKHVRIRVWRYLQNEFKGDE